MFSKLSPHTFKFTGLCASVCVRVRQWLFEFNTKQKKTSFLTAPCFISFDFLSVFVFIITVYVFIVFHISCSVSL